MKSQWLGLPQGKGKRPSLLDSPRVSLAPEANGMSWGQTPLDDVGSRRSLGRTQSGSAGGWSRSGMGRKEDRGRKMEAPQEASNPKLFRLLFELQEDEDG